MENLDDLTIYVFVRGDLPEEQQLVQAAHAVFNMARTDGWPSGEPRIVALDGGSSEKAFKKTQHKLENAGIRHVQYVDPDIPEVGVSAITTYPILKEQSLPLANYRLRRAPVAQMDRASVADIPSV